MKNHKGQSPTPGAALAPRARLRALALASLLALSGHSLAIETRWSVDLDVALWYTPAFWTNGLPTALDTAILTRSPDSIADMNGVDWTVGGIEMSVDGPVTLCGRMAGLDCGSTNDPPGATLTIAPPVAGGTAFTTRYVDVNPYLASYLMAMTGTFQHMSLVSAGRFEVTPGSKLNDLRPNHFKLQVVDVTWLHHGVIEVNLGGGAGMLELRNSTLGNIGIAPNLTVNHKRYTQPESGAPSRGTMYDADVYLMRSQASFSEVVTTGQIGVEESVFEADTLTITGGGRYDHGWNSRTTVRAATMGTNAGIGTLEVSNYETKPDAAAPAVALEQRELRITESLTLGTNDGSSGFFKVLGGNRAIIGRPETTGKYGERVLFGGVEAGSSGHVSVHPYGELIVHGRATLGYYGAGHLDVQGRMIVSGDLELGNGGDTASAVALVGDQGELEARNLYVGADYFELMYGENNPYGSGQGHLTVQEGGVVRITGETFEAPFEGAPTWYYPGNVYVGRNDTLDGKGLIEFVNPAGGAVINLGTVSPGNSPGVLTIDGDFRFNNSGAMGGSSSSGGRLVIELGGTAPGTGYDVLHVLGDMDLTGGILEIVAIDGFVPGENDVFAFLRVGGTITGSFATLVDNSGLGLTLDDLQFGPGGTMGLNVAAVPEPGEWMLLIAGLGMVGWMVRRRMA